MRRASAKVRKPSEYEARVLTMIARSALIKTRSADKPDPQWGVDGLGSISDKCAQALIRHGWVKPQRDGLPMFDETQVYKALTP